MYRFTCRRARCDPFALLRLAKGAVPLLGSARLWGGRQGQQRLPGCIVLVGVRNCAARLSFAGQRARAMRCVQLERLRNLKT